MSIRYVRVKRRVAVGATPGIKFFAKIFMGEAYDFEKIAAMIAETSAMSEGDIMSVLKQLEKVISWQLLMGHPVKLGMLGTFYPGISAKAVDTLEGVTVETIRRIYCRFRPSVWLNKELKDSKKSIEELDVKGYQPKPTPPAGN